MAISSGFILFNYSTFFLRIDEKYFHKILLCSGDKIENGVDIRSLILKALREMVPLPLILRRELFYSLTSSSKLLTSSLRKSR